MYEVISTLSLIILLLWRTCEASRPNFLIMMADDLGYGDIGCYGNNTIKTPNIDVLAKNGIKLTHHLAASSVCTPSRSAFLTGRYPIRSGMAETGKLRVLPFVASSGGLPPNETTFAKVLKDFGYSTGLIGKWHLGVNCRVYNDNCHHPLTHGFDYFYGLPLTNLKDFGNDGAGVFMSNNPRIKTGLSSAIVTITLAALFIARYYSPKRPCFTFFASVALTAVPLTVFYVFITNIKILNSVLMANTTVVEQPIDFSNDLSQRLLDRGIEFLKRHAPSPVGSNDAHIQPHSKQIPTQIHQQQPFLLFFSFLQVHTALHTAPRFTGSSIHGRFGDNVYEMDWMVGQLLQTLDDLGLRNNTFVYFTSDQGGHIEEKGLDGQREGGYNAAFKGGKGQGGMEGGIRVPGIISYPPLTDTFRQLDQDVINTNNSTNTLFSSHSASSLLAKVSKSFLHYGDCNGESSNTSAEPYTGVEINVPTSLMDLWPTIVNLARPELQESFENRVNKNLNLASENPLDLQTVSANSFLSEEDDDYELYVKLRSVDKTIDGLDLMPMLWNFSAHYSQYVIKDKNIRNDQKINNVIAQNNSSIHRFQFNHHEFLFHYCGTDIHAVRYMPKNDHRIWKIYYITPKWIPGTQECHYVCFCYGRRNVIRHDPPLLFELTTDPFEDRCILPNIEAYQSHEANTLDSERNGHTENNFANNNDNSSNLMFFLSILFPNHFNGGGPSTTQPSNTNNIPISYSHCFKDRLYFASQLSHHKHSSTASPTSQKSPKYESDPEYTKLRQLYYEVLDRVQSAVARHQADIIPVPSQFSARNTMWKPWLQPCCNPPWCHCHQSIPAPGESQSQLKVDKGS